MRLNVLIIPDKFKGSLDAVSAAAAIARGWRATRPDDVVDVLPMSDGGDGFGAVMGGLLGTETRIVETVNAAHEHCQVKYGWVAKSKTAIVESARVVGLAMLRPGRYHPFDLDTWGLGKVLTDAAAQGAETCIIGVGGSATNDGGFGMARSLGWQFLDPSLNPIKAWMGLRTLHQIEPPRSKRLFSRLIVAVDVQNVLLGHKGATRVYGPQKGLKSWDMSPADAAMRRLTRVMESTLQRDYSHVAGAGAAGGLGFGLMAFLGAKPASGFDLFATHSDLRRRLRTADLVITGEGAIDRSTLMGKGVGIIADLCAKCKIPCIGLAGSVLDSATVKKQFAVVRGLTEITTEKEARIRPAYWLEQLAQNAALNPAVA